MAGDSHVGSRSLYEAGDQRHVSIAELEEARRNREHPPVSNRRGSAHAHEQNHKSGYTNDQLNKISPTAPAKMHGHRPSKGAEIDAELRREDELRMKEKGYK